MDEQERHAAARALYDRLREMARFRMSGNSASHTLEPTALANEAILRLLRCDAAGIRDEAHFLALAAEAMRQVLVDHARAKLTLKRGGQDRRRELVPEETFPTLEAEPEQVLEAHEALCALEASDAEAAGIIKLRLFAAIPPEEIAALLGVSRRTLDRRLRFSLATMRAWILSHPSKES